MTGSRPARIMLVDDNPIVVLALSEVLIDEGFDIVGTAGDADGAVALARRALPDVAVVDMSMPGGGAAATAGIRTVSEQTVVVILSAHDIERYRVEAAAAGARLYLVKGVDDVVDALGRLVGGAQ